MADGVGGYMIEVKPSEAADQGEWKCVASNPDGGMSVSTCEVKMTSKHMYIIKLFSNVIHFFCSSQTLQKTQVYGQS